jgi:hypothetical protein
LPVVIGAGEGRKPRDLRGSIYALLLDAGLRFEAVGVRFELLDF